MSYTSSVIRPAASRRGTSLIEIMVVVAIMIVISVITVVNLSGRRSTGDLTNSTEQITTILREAQSRSASELNGATWGVYLANTTGTAPFYALYKNSYSQANTVGYYRLPADIQFATSSIPAGSSTSVTFSPNSGLPSASTSITIQLVPQGVFSTITISAPGLIAYSSTTTAPTGGGSSPGQPGTPSYASVQSSTLTVNWSAATGATSYKLQRSTDGNSFAQIALPGGTSYPDSGLTPSSTYWYRVLGTNGSGDGPVSASSSIQTAALPLPNLISHTINPTPVQGGLQNSTGTVTLSGPAPAGGAQVTLPGVCGPTICVPSSVTVPQGATSATYTIITYAVGIQTTVRINAFYNSTTIGTNIVLTPSSMWTANQSANSVTKVTLAGVTTTYVGTGAAPYAIAFDGTNMWTANFGDNSVTKITPGGATTTYSGTGANPDAIAFDGTNMWTANWGGNSVTKITPAGATTTYSGTGASPDAIAFDGTNMWTANYSDNSVTKISPTGTMMTFNGTGLSPYAIAFDGTNMWTANSNGNSVTKITPTGATTTYSGTGTHPQGIAFDGRLLYPAW